MDHSKTFKFAFQTCMQEIQNLRVSACHCYNLYCLQFPKAAKRIVFRTGYIGNLKRVHSKDFLVPVHINIEGKTRGIFSHYLNTDVNPIFTLS